MNREDERSKRSHLIAESENSSAARSLDRSVEFSGEDQWSQLLEIVKQDPFSKFTDGHSSGTEAAVARRVVPAAPAAVSDSLDTLLHSLNDDFEELRGKPFLSQHAEPFLQALDSGESVPKGHDFWQDQNQMARGSSYKDEDALPHYLGRSGFADHSLGLGEQESALDRQLFLDSRFNTCDSSRDLSAGSASYSPKMVRSDSRGFSSLRFFWVSLISFLGLAILGISFFYPSLISFSSFPKSGGLWSPPVIGADREPVKVKPLNPGGVDIPNQNKLVYDRVAGEDSSVEEKILVREEEVIAINDSEDSSALGEFPRAQVLEVEPPTGVNQEEEESLQGARVVSSASFGSSEERSSSQEELSSQEEKKVDSYRGGIPVPRKVQTVVISRNSRQTGTSEPVSKSAVRHKTGEERETVSGAKVLTRPTSNAKGMAAPVIQKKSGVAKADMEGKFVIQLAARKSEQMALDAYKVLQGRYPALGSYSPLIQRADLGERGLYYRLRIGPFRASEEAESFCSQLKASGLKDCMVRPSDME